MCTRVSLCSWQLRDIESPCIQVCTYDDDEVCMGCYRSADEITEWIYTTDDRKLEILENCRHREMNYGKTS